MFAPDIQSRFIYRFIDAIGKSPSVDSVAVMRGTLQLKCSERYGRCRTTENKQDFCKRNPTTAKLLKKELNENGETPHPPWPL